jgi:hypothetical protein
VLVILQLCFMLLRAEGGVIKHTDSWQGAVAVQQMLMLFLACWAALFGILMSSSCCCCAGGLTIPSLPAIPGLDTFPGGVFHTARWDHSVDLKGKRVAVVGTGKALAHAMPCGWL